MKILIIGFGSIGKVHFNNLKILGYNDIEICDMDIDKNHKFKSLYDIQHVKDYDLILVCTPTETHLSILHYLNDRQVKNIVIEKPLCLLPTQYQILLENGFAVAHRELKSNVFVNHAYRFDRGLNKLKQLLESGQYGNIRHAILENSYDYDKLHKYPIEKYDGIIYDDSHIINTSRYLFGEPTKILTKHIDNKLATFTWVNKDNSVTTHITDVYSQIYKKRIEVRCDKGNLIWNYGAHEIWFCPSDETERVAIPYQHTSHLMEALKYVLNKVENNEKFDINTIEDSMSDLCITWDLIK